MFLNQSLLPAAREVAPRFSSFSLLFMVALSVLFTGNLYAQSSQLSSYVILGGDPGCAGGSNCGVKIQGNVSINGGSIGSHADLYFNHNSTHSGSVYSREDLDLGNSVSISGNCYVANTSGSSGNVLTGNYNVSIGGDLLVNGDAQIASGSIAGTLTYPPSASYSGPTPAGGVQSVVPSFNNLPAMPPPLVFPPAGNTDVTNSGSIVPGAYDLLKLTGGKTVTFSGTGDYVFEKIKTWGSINTIVFDFQNNPNGVIRILVHEDVSFGATKVEVINGGDASKIWLETHDVSGTSAFQIKGGAFGDGTYSSWLGTVYAPYQSIKIGGGDRIDITGALFSPHAVTALFKANITHVPFGSCNPASFNLQVEATDTIECNAASVTLSATANASAGSFSWTTSEGNIVSGGNTANPVVDAPGWYVVSVSENGCSTKDSILVIQESCIDPYYPAPEDGKTNTNIGSELGQLAANSNFQDTSQIVYQINNDSVYIEIIVVAGQYQSVLSLLQTPQYGLTNLIDNGLNTLIISGLFPIQNLPKLDSVAGINYVRPLFPALIKRGVALTQGDAALNAPFVRGGFDVNGEGVKIGVLSDSYNKLPGNPATTDISNEDLPGPGNPVNSVAVDVVKEYPFGGGTDEGRAMLQIIHDIAPKAELAFRTGYVSAGDFAQGIIDLAADSCNIIVDDITYITEPFLSDGVISQAVNTVVGQGVTYLSSAGNFGDNSYGSIFNPAPAPGDIVGSAHDFGGGDVYQSVSLQPGNYLMVLQWQDSIYSIGQTVGTNNDLDFYLTDDEGNTLFGFNRNNLGGDPLEIMPFTVKQVTQSNILIVRAAGTDNVPFKVVIFRGDLTFNEHSAGTSTIIGHPNAEGAIAVGAVRYDQTPEYGVDPPVVETFSSVGGTAVGGVVRNKPEICAVNGVNTTVDLGSGDYEGDGLPNFFGTSAAAPHAAAVAALIQSAKLKYEGSMVSPAEMKNILSNSAIDMGAPGFDFETGNGFIQADVSLLTIASPNPVVYSITLLDTTKTPGVDTILVRIEGDYFTGDTKILLRNDTLESSTTGPSSIETEVPPFTGNPPITAYIDPITSSGLDGGGSNDSLFFLNQVQKQKVQVVMDDQTKLYGEQLPALTYQVLIDSIPIDSTGLSLADLGLDNMNITTTATSMSNVGFYLIRATQRSLDPGDPFDAGLLDLYTWEFIDAQLTIEKMPLTISVKDTTLPYGVLINDFDFEYDYPDSLVSAADSINVYDSIFVNHTTNIANAVVLINAKAEGAYKAAGRVLVNAVKEQTYMASGRVLVNSRPLANANFTSLGFPDTTFIVDVSAESLFDYEDGSDTVTLSNAFTAEGAEKEYTASSRVLVNALEFASGRVLVNAVAEDGTKYVASSRVLVNAVPIVNAMVGADGEYVASGRVLVNGYPIVNGEPVNQDSSEIVFILDEADADTTLTDSIFPFTPINMLLGNGVGEHPIIPAALFNPNFNISYEFGTLTVTADTLEVKADTLTSTYGDSIHFGYKTTGYEYADADSSVIKGPPTYSLLDSNGVVVTGNKINAGVYSIVPDSLDFGDTTDYIAKYTNGQLTVLPAPLMVNADSSSAVYGDPVNIPVSISGFRYDDDTANSVMSGPGYDLFDIGGTPYTNPVLVVGVYSLQLKDLQLTIPWNYSIQYGSAPLSITPADLTVTARDTSKVEGDINPPLMVDISGFKFDDGPGDIVMPTISTTATTGSPAGPYPINLSGGSAANYNLILVNGTLTIVNQNTLTVIPDTIGILAGQTVSNFTYQLDGNLMAGDVVLTDPSFTTSPSNYSSPGVYDIIASNLVVSNAAAYNINYQNGKLYVNPYGFWAFHIRIGYVCVDTVLNHPSGYNWKVTFYYTNYNNTPVYIPHGNYNDISGAPHWGSSPEVFDPGTGYFDIYFDGSSLKWNVSSYSLFSRRWRKKIVSSSSRKCFGYYSKSSMASGDSTSNQGRTGSEPGNSESFNDLLAEDSPDLFPNPTTGIVYVMPAHGVSADEYGIEVLDVTGRLIQTRIPNSNENGLIKLDLGNLSSGIYLIRVSDSKESYYFRVSKDE